MNEIFNSGEAYRFTITDAEIAKIIDLPLETLEDADTFDKNINSTTMNQMERKKLVTIVRISVNNVQY